MCLRTGTKAERMPNPHLPAYSYWTATYNHYNHLFRRSGSGDLERGIYSLEAPVYHFVPIRFIRRRTFMRDLDRMSTPGETPLSSRSRDSHT